MATRKGTRADDDDDNDNDGSEGIEIENASSSFRNSNTQKRFRVSSARQNGGSIVSDETDDPLTTEEWDGIPLDAEDSDIDELRASQVLEAGMRRDADRAQHHPPVAHGVIEEVFCRNFMCHANLRVKLGDKINFIIGHNGSGKSAVLTALQMCLGGKAQSTNRATNLKGMIKEGEESATVAVKIKNQGEDAFRPEMYGESITVERHFSRSGTSGFRIKSDSDKTITTKRADLDGIMDYFAFQLDNPINVLTQDLARQFLSNSTPAEKYKLFIRGTQLEALDTDYKLLEEHRDNIDIKLAARQEDVHDLKNKADEAEQRKKASDRMASLEENMQKLQWMHAWAQVEETERAVARAEEREENAKRNLQEMEGRAQETESNLEGKTQALDAAKRNTSEMEDKVPPLVARRDEEKAKFDEGKRDLSNLVSQQRNIKENMRQHNKIIDARKKEIQLEESRLASAGGDEHAERLARLDELATAAAQAKQQVQEHAGQRAEHDQNCSSAAKEAESARAAADQAKERHRQAAHECRQMERAQPSPWAGYRANMESLVRAIRQESRWQVPPVGPMGTHVKLLDETWMSQIEKTFGATLDGFVVTNVQDSNLLGQVMRRVKCVAPVLIGSPEPLNTTGKEPDDNVTTIMRVLEIDNHAVRNALIINHTIEQTALIEDRNEARGFMFDAPTPPRNVRATICLAADRSKGVRFEATRSGGEKSNPVDAWRGATRMKSNHEQQIRIQKNNVERAQRDMQSAETNLRSANNASKAAKERLEGFKRQLQRLTAEQQRAENDVDNLQQEIDDSHPQDGKLQELERQLSEAQKEYQSASDSYQDSVVARDLTDVKQADVKRQMDDAQKELDEMLQRLAQAKERASGLELERREASHDHDRSHQRVDEARKQIETAQQRLKDQQEGLTEMVGEASRFTPHGRVPVEEGMNPSIIDDRLKKLAKEKKDQELRIGGTIQQLTLAYHKAFNEFQEALNQMENISSVSKELADALHYRQHRWLMFRKFISLRARRMFKYLLSERQFRGRATIDHVTKELDIMVEPDLTKLSDAGRETKTLSGGEKSFSTICLLLSIWEAMGSPIRCLDEFDVFMDSVNRSTSMNMMIQAARRAVGRQFILITPQAMNNVDLGPDIRIHKMSDPERGQQTLVF